MSRGVKTLVGAGVLGLALAAAPSTANAADRTWQASHAGGAASGTWTYSGTNPLETSYVVNGRLTAPASGCVSVWSGSGLAPGLAKYSKAAGACNGQTVPVAATGYLGSLTGGVSLHGFVKVCRGSSQSVCSEAVAVG